jgi:hypothetical protein
MAFLDDFTSWNDFVSKFPGMKDAKSVASVIFDLDLGDYVEKQPYQALVQKYGKSDVEWGIFTLLGFGKGKNQKTLHLGSVILKYGNLALSIQAAESTAFQATVVACVDKARELLSAVCARFQKQEDALLDEVVSHHFKIGRSSSLWQTVKANFITLAQGLGGVVRIADNVPGQVKAGAPGYVNWMTKKDHGNLPVSPFKTSGINPSAKKKDEEEVLAGSIHIDYVLFKKCPTGNFPKVWSNLAIAGLIIHEGSHKFCFTEDHAYVHNGHKYDVLSPELRCKNADSYGYTAASVGNGKLIKSDDDPALNS